MPKTHALKSSEAAARLANRRRVSNREQLAALDSRPGEAKAERARLMPKAKG